MFDAGPAILVTVINALIFGNAVVVLLAALLVFVVGAPRRYWR